jgi:hypothetical protein
MATKSLVSVTATLGIERRGGGGQGREAPGIPGCHPRSRPHVPRLLPPPLAAASARETRRSGADDREAAEGDPPRDRATSEESPAPHPPHPKSAPNAPDSRRRGGALKPGYPPTHPTPPSDALFPRDLEVSGTWDKR